MQNKWLSGLLGAVFIQLVNVGAAHAATAIDDGAAAAADETPHLGVDLDVARQHQEFTDNSADVTTVSVQPYWRYNNWELSVDLPWQKAEGGYFVNRFPPRLQYACDRVAQLSAKQLSRHPKKAELNQFCQSNGIGSANIPDSVAGLSDISAALRYGLPLDERGIWLLSVGGAYKFANGDTAKNLGSGTRDTSLDMALGASYGWLGASMTAGNTWLAGANGFSDRSHYVYAILDASLQPLHWLALGCSYDYQQSYTRKVDDMKKFSVYARVKPWDKLGIKVYVSDYGNSDSYPEREYGASLSLMY